MQITFPVFNSVEITCIGSRDYTSKNRDEAAIASLYDLELLNNEICKFLSGNVTVLEMLRFFFKPANRGFIRLQRNQNCFLNNEKEEKT